MLKKLKYICNKTWTHRSELTCIYVFQLIFSLLIGIITFITINDNIGQSMSLEHLAIGFDRTVFEDMINSNNHIFSKILTWGSIIIPIYLILSIVLQGGLLCNIRKGKIDIKSQVKNGLIYFFPFLGLTMISFFMILLLSGLFMLPFIILVGDPLTTFSSEKPFVFLLIGLAFIFSIILITGWAFNVSARLHCINGSTFGKAIHKAFLFIKYHFLKILFIGYLLLGIHSLLSFIYYIIMSDRGASSWLLVIFIVIIQQLFSFVRVYTRGLGYVAIVQMDDRTK